MQPNQDNRMEEPMREVDRRSKFNRRIFLQGAASTVPAVAVATGAGLGITDAWADDATSLSPATLKTLVKVARDIYPPTATTSPRSSHGTERLPQIPPSRP
jgi:hypothetical protein